MIVVDKVKALISSMLKNFVEIVVVDVVVVDEVVVDIVTFEIVVTTFLLRKNIF
jgi:hypothetical protein